MPPRRRVIRLFVISGLSVVAAAVAWFITALVLFVFPQQQPLHAADAIVSLSPPRDRLPVALHAFEDELAPRLWVSYVPRDLALEDDRMLVADTCASDPARVECFTPLSDDTIGEARAVARLVEKTGAKSVIVTTNTSHSARARYLFEHCLPAGTDVQLLLVPEPQRLDFLFGRMLYETGAYAKAIAEVSLCDG